MARAGGGSGKPACRECNNCNMTALRNAHHLARFVLVWFALSLGVAIASPLVKPQAMELICSGAGAMKLVIQTDDGGQEVTGLTLDCPLCAASSAPPPPAALLTAEPSPPPASPH